jgi:tetratricopeptide (TPR) repeat protein
MFAVIYIRQHAPNWDGYLFKDLKTMTTPDNTKFEIDRQQAEKRLQAGIEAYNDGNLPKAIEALGDAEIRFRLIGDFKRAGDSRSMAADAQHESKQFEQALNSYQRAKNLYKDAHRTLLEANVSLSMGHIEREMIHLDRAQDLYQGALQVYKEEQYGQGMGNAELALGHVELQRGNTEYAAEHYQQAIQHYQAAHDNIHEADASRSLADIQRMARQYDTALQAYQRALDIYRQTKDFFGAIDAQVGLGQIYLEQEQPNRASDIFAEALRQAALLEYELGQADANLGLAEAMLMQARADQALIGAQSAQQVYIDQHNALGSAHADRVLAEVNLRRGQPSYASSLMERALRTYQSVAFRLGTIEALVGLGEIQLWLGSLDRALTNFNEGRSQARRFHNIHSELRALLGVGDVYRQQGQSSQARNAYNDAIERSQELDAFAGARLLARVHVNQARLAINTGDLKEAERYLALAIEDQTHNPLAQQIIPSANVTRGQWFLTVGDVEQAESHYKQARQQADTYQQPLMAAEATLGLAQTDLAREEMTAANDTFLEAGRQFQLLESTGGDGSSVLGVAQVNIGQQLWDEAIANSDAALLRFKQVGDLPAQASALLTRGLAHRGKDELEEAMLDFEEALHLYHQAHNPLGVVDTRSARAGIYFLRGDLDQARDEQTKAITQVERVMNTIGTPQQWSTFLQQYAELYAQTAITDIRRGQEEQARTLLQNFAQVAGLVALKQRLLVYINDIPTTGEELSEEELASNKDLVRRIEQVRKGLS